MCLPLAFLISEMELVVCYTYENFLAFVLGSLHPGAAATRASFARWQAVTPVAESTLQNRVLCVSSITSPLGSRPRSASPPPARERLLPPSQTLNGQVAVCCPIGGPSGLRTNVLLGPASQCPHPPARTPQRLTRRPQPCTGRASGPELLDFRARVLSSALPSGTTAHLPPS